MKKIYYILAALVICSLAVSCSKEGIGTDSSDTSEYSFADHECDSKNSVHHPAVSPGVQTWGNVEYWECPVCSKRYADAEGTQPVSEEVLLLPECKTVIPYATLHAYDDIIKFGDEINAPEQTAAGTKLAATAIASAVLSACSAIVKIGFMLGTPDVDGTSAALEDIRRDLQDIEKELKKISEKQDDIIERLSHLSETIESITTQQLCVEERHNQIISLENGVIPLYETICDHYDRMKSPGADTLAILEDVKKDIRYWAEKSEGLMLTQSLLKSFRAPLATKITLTFPDVLGNYTDYFCNWSDEGYNYRSQVLLEDRYYISFGYAFSQAYYNICKDCSQIERDVHIDMNETLLADYESCYDADIEYRQQLDQTYCVFISEGIRYYFNKELQPLNTTQMYNWCELNLSLMNSEGYQGRYCLYVNGDKDREGKSEEGKNININVFETLIPACPDMFDPNHVSITRFNQLYATRSSGSQSVESFLDSRFTNRGSRWLFAQFDDRNYTSNGKPAASGGGTYGEFLFNTSWDASLQDIYLHVGISGRSGSNAWSSVDIAYGFASYLTEERDRSMFVDYDLKNHPNYEQLKMRHCNPDRFCYILLEKTDHI